MKILAPFDKVERNSFCLLVCSEPLLTHHSETMRNPDAVVTELH
jgi:hypothetical protein